MARRSCARILGARERADEGAELLGRDRALAEDQRHHLKAMDHLGKLAQLHPHTRVECTPAQRVALVTEHLGATILDRERGQALELGKER